MLLGVEFPDLDLEIGQEGDPQMAHVHHLAVVVEDVNDLSLGTVNQHDPVGQNVLLGIPEMEKDVLHVAVKGDLVRPGQQRSVEFYDGKK